MKKNSDKISSGEVESTTMKWPTSWARRVKRRDGRMDGDGTDKMKLAEGRVRRGERERGIRFSVLLSK